MDAERIVAEVRRRYAEARRYDDRGTFVLFRDGGMQGRFETLFERGALLAFSAEVESADPPRKDAYRFRDEGGKFEYHSTIVPPPPFELKVTSVDLAIAAFLGVTMGASFYVPALLLPQMEGFIHLFDRGRPRLGKSVAIAGVPQLAIEIPTHDEFICVHVGEADLVIRCVELFSAEGGPLFCRTDYRAVLG